MNILLTGFEPFDREAINPSWEAVKALDRTTKRFEERANQCVDRLQASSVAIQATTKEHHTAALKAQEWVNGVSLGNRLWPCVASAAIGALLMLLVVYFRAK